MCNTFAGNVRIGTTTTAARVQINGVGQHGANPNPAGPGVVPCLLLTDDAAGGGLGGMVVFGAGVGQFAAIEGLMDVSVGNTTGHIVFCTRGGQADATLNERLRIESNGNVGIGTNNPGYALAVQPDRRRMWVAYETGDFFVSADLGTTWDSTGAPSSESHVVAIAAEPGDDGWLLAVTRDGRLWVRIVGARRQHG